MPKKQKITEKNSTWIITQLCTLDNPNWGVYGMALDNDGHLFFTTGTEHLWRIHRDKKSKPDSVLQVEKGALHGIVWDGNDVIYICDSNRHRILSYSVNNLGLLLPQINGTSYSTLCGYGEKGLKDGNIKTALFWSPHEIVVDKNGDLYVADNHHVRKICLQQQTVETIAGSTTGLQNGYKDGPANQAVFKWLIGIVVDDDTIYVSDGWNCCIRQIKDKTVSTLCGTPRQPGYANGTLHQSRFTMPSELFLMKDGAILVHERGYAVRVVNVKKNIVSTSKPPGIQKSSRLFMDSNGTMFLGSRGGIVRLDSTWAWERFLWIGYLKEDSNYCHLARVPKDIVNEISGHLRHKLINKEQL